MDITGTVYRHRSDPLLLGDYNAYRALCSRRISKLRRNLYGKSNTKSRKYVVKGPVTAQNIGHNIKYVSLLLYTAERAWAFAMYMKSDSGNTAPIGPTRGHIITRFNKAYRYASQLLAALQETESNAKPQDVLEARAYADSLAGAVAFEKKQWEKALIHLSTARVIYVTLSKAPKSDILRDALSSNIDPSVRYSAYQLRLPRNQDIDSTCRQYFPKDDDKVLSALRELDPDVLQEVPTDSVAKAATVQSITWRSRKAPVEDADVAIALGNVATAEKNLESYLDENKSATGKTQADHFDEILAAWQESVDVTKKAIDDALGDGANAGDEKIQALQITYTYVNYNLLSWRIRRNRVMATGVLDDKMQGTKRLNGLKEEVVLWDAILQSLEQATELPGVAADEEFGKELEGKRLYFHALKCSAIAQSHAIQGNRLNALGLYYRALTNINTSLDLLSAVLSSTDKSSANISATELQQLQTQLKADVQRYHGLAEMDRLNAEAAAKAAKTKDMRPMIEKLDEYPEHGVDFTNLITFPPQVKPIPVKPIFYDIAWHYIEYPGQEKEAPTVQREADDEEEEEVKVAEKAPQQQKKGWFGWGS